MRRVESQRAQEKRVQVTSPGDVAAIYALVIRDQAQKVVHVVPLSVSKTVLRS
jgi:hypothetical protein